MGITNNHLIYLIVKMVDYKKGWILGYLTMVSKYPIKREYIVFPISCFLPYCKGKAAIVIVIVNETNRIEMVKTHELKNQELKERMKRLSGLNESVVSQAMPSKYHDRQTKFKSGQVQLDDLTNDMEDEEMVDLEELLFELELQSILEEMGYYEDDE